MLVSKKRNSIIQFCARPTHYRHVKEPFGACWKQAFPSFSLIVRLVKNLDQSLPDEGIEGYIAFRRPHLRPPDEISGQVEYDVARLLHEAAVYRTIV